MWSVLLRMLRIIWSISLHIQEVTIMRSKFSLEEKYDMIMECRSSGLSDFQWCKQHSIQPSTFYGWVNQVRRQHSDIPDQPGRHNTKPAVKQDVVKLEIIDGVATDVPPVNIQPQASSPYTVEISVGNSTSIRLANDVNPALLAQIMSALGTSL